jgi:integrase/recombinase XerD
VTPAEFAEIYKQPNPRYPSGRRNRAILAVMYYTGLRRQEVCNLAPDDVDTEDAWIHVRDGKGGRDRDLPLDEALGAPLLAWWTTRQASPPMAKSPWFFCTSSGGKLGPRYLHSMVTRYSGKAGVYKRKMVKLRDDGAIVLKDDGSPYMVEDETEAWPHCLRHACAANMVEAKVPLPLIQEALGHASLQSTSVYTRMRPESLRDAVRAGAEVGARTEGPSSRAQRVEGMADGLAELAALADA